MPMRYAILAGAFVAVVLVYLFVIGACRAAGAYDRDLERNIDEG